MAKQVVDIGVEGNDGTGDSLRESFQKVNENFSELYAAVGGVGGDLSFRNLSDTPSSFSANSNKLLVVSNDETGIIYRELVSNGETTGDSDDDTIQFDFSESGKLIVKTANVVYDSGNQTIDGNKIFTSPITVSNASPFLKLQETGITNTPTWWVGGDNGDFNLRLNNTGTYPIDIKTNASNNSITSINLNNNSVFVDVENNRVGFFTDTPSTTIEIVGDTIITGNSSTDAFTIVQTGSGNALLIEDTSGSDATPFVVTGDGSVGVGTSTPSEKLNVIGNAEISGSISKGSGTFKIDHPIPKLSKSHYLIHSFIEGPKADLIYRGTVSLENGEASVNIDDISNMTTGTFEHLCDDIQCFVSNVSGWALVKSRVDGNILHIESNDKNCNDLISWLVIGERKDQTIKQSPYTDESGKLIVEMKKT